MRSPLEIRPRRGRRLLHGLRPGARDLVVLRLDDDGIHVRNSVDEGPDAWAHLAWPDCAAVVVSPGRAIPGQPPATYVQFVPHDERAVVGSPDGDAVGGRALLCDLSRSAARTAWLELPGGRSRIPEVLEFANERVAELRVVDSRR